MTLPVAGVPAELAAVFVNVVPSLAGSQSVLQDAAREGARLYAQQFEAAVGPELSAAMGRIAPQMTTALSSGLGSAAGQAILSRLLPSESAVAGHMSRIGAAGAKGYVAEFERNFKNMVPVVEDVSARAVAANKALVEQTKAMGGQMSSFWYTSSKEATQAGDEMMSAWASKMKVGVAAAGAMVAVEFVRNVKKEFTAFEHVGEDAAGTLISGWQTVMQGKMPDLIAPFNVLEEAAKTSMEAPLQVAQTFIPALGLVRRAVDDLFGPFDRLKDVATPVMETLLETGNEYLQLQRTLAGATLEPEKIEGLSNVVREIMASGAVVHFEDVADSIGRLSQNIKGLNVDQLKELTTTFAMAEELVGHIDETKFAGVINAWKIPAAEANSTLTMLTNTARATGININELTSEMIRSGPAFRDIGYSAQQTAAFFGEMSAQGEQGQRLVLAMMEADKKLNEQVEQGKFPNAKAAWEALLTAVKQYEDAGQHAAALNLLDQYISPRVAPMFLEMLKNGKVSAEQLGDAIEGVNTDIGESVEKTKDLGQTFEVLKQQIGAAMSPVGRELAAGLRDGGNHVTEWLKENQGKVAQWAADIAKDFLNVGTFMVTWFAGILNAMSPMFIAMKDAILAVTLPLGGLAKGMAEVFGGGWQTLSDSINSANSGLMNFNIAKTLGDADAAINDFAKNTLPKWDAAIQAPVDNLKLDDEMRKKGFKFWFEDGDPAKVKVKGQTPDGKDIDTAADVVPPGETTLTFVPGFDQPKWHGQAPPQGFAFGGPTVQGDWKGKGDTIPAMLEVGEYVVRRDQAQKHRRELDAINYGYAGFDAGGDVDPGLTVLYGFLRGAAEGVGLNLPKDKAGDGGSGLPSMYASVAAQSAPQLAAAAASPGHGGDVKTAAFNAMIAAGGQPSDWAAIDYIFSHESSWRTDAQNNWDINAQHGDPSKGLGQLISGNYRAAGVDPNTKDPYAQTYAAVRYMQSRYGGIQQAYQYWLGHHNYAEGGHVGGGSPSWFGTTPHEHPGPNTASIAKHFAHFAGGGLTCAECGGAHPTAFHEGGVAHFAQGGDVGEAFSQVIWSNKETGQDIGENAGKWVGTPGSADPGFYHRGHNDFADHTGHVHTTVLRDPFTGAPYDQIRAGSNITAGSTGFPDWVYRLGRMYHVKPSTYPGHQEWNGVNHGIDWWPEDATPNMTGQGYSHQDFVTLTGFATAVGSMSAGQSQGAPVGAGFAGGTPGWQGFGVPIGAGGTLPGAPYPTDGGGDSSTFSGGSFPPGSPIGPGGLIGPGYNPWTNPPPGLRGDKLQDYVHKYEQWQLEEDQRRRRHGEAQDALTDAINEQKKAYDEWKALDDKWKAETADQQKLDTETAKKLQEATNKLSEANSRLEHARDTATQDQLDDQVGHPPPKPEHGGRQGGPFEGMSEQLGSGLVKGIFQELGFPDVFGKPFTQWGLWKLGMGVLGFGLNYANNFADAQGGGQGGFPGSLPGQFGGPLGPPPGPPPGSVSPPSPTAPPPGTPDHPLSVQGAPNKPPVHTEPAKPAPPHPAAPSLPWPPKPPLPEPGQPGGGPPLGIPGSEGGGPQVFSVPRSPQPYHTAAYYEQQADQPSPFSFASDSLGAGAVGGDYMKQLVDKGPAFLVGLQDQGFRDKTFGGNKNSPSKLAGQMQAANPDQYSRYATSARNVNFNNYNTGVTDTKTIAKVTGAHYDQEKRWAPSNQMFRTGVTIS